jgi:hypothetical protein
MKSQIPKIDEISRNQQLSIGLHINLEPFMTQLQQRRNAKHRLAIELTHLSITLQNLIHFLITCLSRLGPPKGFNGWIRVETQTEEEK